MKKYEYEVINVGGRLDDIEEILNRRGKLGWKLISVGVEQTFYFVVMEREFQEPQSVVYEPTCKEDTWEF